jgi:hypothetical protein
LSFINCLSLLLFTRISTFFITGSNATDREKLKEPGSKVGIQWQSRIFSGLARLFNRPPKELVVIPEEDYLRFGATLGLF